MSMDEIGNPFHVEVDEIPNPHRQTMVDRFGTEIPFSQVCGSAHIPIVPSIPTVSTILATEEGTQAPMDEEEVSEILQDAVSEPVPYVPEQSNTAIELLEEVESGLEEELAREPIHHHHTMEVRLSDLLGGCAILGGASRGATPFPFPEPVGVEANPKSWDSDHFPTADTYLKEMQETYAERGKVYGNSCLKAGKVLKAMIPEGVLVETEQDYAIMAVLGIMTHKMCRALNPLAARHKLGLPEDAPIHMSDLGHQDSIHDLSVYTALWEELFIRAKGGK